MCEAVAKGLHTVAVFSELGDKGTCKSQRKLVKQVMAGLVGGEVR